MLFICDLPQLDLSAEHAHWRDYSLSLSRCQQKIKLPPSPHLWKLRKIGGSFATNEEGRLESKARRPASQKIVDRLASS